MKILSRILSLTKIPSRLIFILLLAACSGSPDQKPTSTPLPASSRSSSPAYPVQRGEVTKELVFKGKVVPVMMQELFFRSGGYVRDVYVQAENDVKKGQVLADLEISDLEKQLAQAKISLRASQARLESTKQSIADSLEDAQIALNIEKLRLEEAELTLKNNPGKQQEINVKIQQEQVKLAQLRVDRLERGPDPETVQAVDLAQLEVERLQAMVDDANIKAPFDGKVLLVTIRAGDQVSAFSRTVMTVYDPTKLEIGADLVDKEMQDLSEGLPVSVKPSGPGAKDLPGSIRSLPTPYGTGQTDSAVGQSRDLGSNTRIALTNPDSIKSIKLGSTVEVHALLAQKEGVLWLPPEAIRTFEGRKFVIVQDGTSQRRVNIVIGLETERRIEVTEGLAEGQVVVGQ